jgi:MFS family permease
VGKPAAAYLTPPGNLTLEKSPEVTMTHRVCASPVALEVQRRILAVLVASQVFSGIGVVAGLTGGALLMQQMLGSTTFAGLAGALYTGGSALAAVAVSRISQARGRRPGLAAGYLVGALGSGGVVGAMVVSSPTLLFASLFVYGAGTAANLQARYAGADLAAAAHRGRAVSTVLVATTLGGVVGPVLSGPSGQLAEYYGIPHLAGPFLLALTAYIAAALILTIWLRPDPLTLARVIDRAKLPNPAQETDVGPLATLAKVRRSSLVLGVSTMILAHFVMIAVSTITPLEMHNHGHGAGAVGLVISIHVALMYLPSPVTGWLVDRIGSHMVAAMTGVTFLAAGVAAALAPSASVAMLTLALSLVGLAWNFGLVSGTALITETIPLETRARTQGMVDLSIAMAGATGGLTAGMTVGLAGFPAFSLVGGLIAFALTPAILLTARIS